MSDRDGSGFLWFLAGLGIGAAVGVLYAPKSGDELRQQIREVAEDGRNTVKERARQAREQAGTWADKGRDYLSQQKDQIALRTRQDVRPIAKLRAIRSRVQTPTSRNAELAV